MSKEKKKYSETESGKKALNKAREKYDSENKDKRKEQKRD